MAFSIPESASKASSSKSLVNLPFSDLTKIEESQPACKRHRSVTDMVCRRDRNGHHSTYLTVKACSRHFSKEELGPTYDCNVPIESNLCDQTVGQSSYAVGDPVSTQTLEHPNSSVSDWTDKETSSLTTRTVSVSDPLSASISSSSTQGNNDDDKKILNPPLTLKKLESKIIMGLGIFERDVELGHNNSYDNMIAIITPTQSDDSNHGNRRLEGSLHGFPPGFPAHVLATNGSDGDAIMQAAMRWRREGCFPPDFSSSNDSNGSICRICHSGDTRECLLNPCCCEGTVKWTHQTCLIRWLAEKGILSCELCGAKYRYRRVGTRNCFRWKPIDLTIADKLHLILFTFSIAFLVVTFTVLAWVSFSLFTPTVGERSSSTPVIFPIYTCFDAIALAVVWFEIKHTVLRLCRRWRAKNMGIIILNRKKKEEENAIEMTNHDNTDVKEEEEHISRPDLDDTERRTPT